MQAFSSCGEKGLLCCSAQASHHNGFPCVAWVLCSRVQQLWCMSFSYSTVCGIFQDQWSNPCPLNWQVGSYQVYHQLRPPLMVLKVSVQKLCSPWRLTGRVLSFLFLAYTGCSQFLVIWASGCITPTSASIFIWPSSLHVSVSLLLFS